VGWEQEEGGVFRSMKKLTDKIFWENFWDVDTNLEYLTGLKWLRNYLLYRMHKVFEATLPKDGDFDFLEIGCGGAKWLVYFNKKFGYRVHGLDYSEKAVLRAKKVLAYAGIKSEIIKEDLFTITPNQLYDVVLTDGLVEHFNNLEEVLMVLSSFVKKGGVLVTSVPNLTGLHYFMLKLTGNSQNIFKTHRAVTLKQLISAYNELGFEKISHFCIGSIAPKVFPLPMKFILSRMLTISLRFLYVIGLPLEGNRISNTYMVIGEKK